MADKADRDKDLDPDVRDQIHFKFGIPIRFYSSIDSVHNFINADCLTLAGSR